MNDIYWPPHIEVVENRFYLAYVQLIVRARSRNYQNLNYFEKHHIIPRSLGGLDNESNLIHLTAKEHYLAHRFLTRFTTKDFQYKMLYALDAMGMKSRNTANRWRIPSRVYEYNKLQISIRGHSEETKIKIGLANKGKAPANKGVPRSEETKQKISKGHIGKKGTSANDKIKQSAREYHSNSTWIVDVDNNRKRIPICKLDYYINIGWRLGKGKCKKPKIINVRKHTTEHKEYIKQFVSQLVWIANPLLQKRLRVPLTQLDAYLNQGWVKGRKFD